MGSILDNTLRRRLITIPSLFLGFGVLTIALPLLGVAGAFVDLARKMRSGKPAMAIRMLGFGWVYLLGECWALLSMAAVGLLGRSRSLELTFKLQQMWLDWNFAALRRAFGLTFEVSGQDETAPGPILLLARHASLIDTMLPGRFAVKPNGIRLRYVLKKELLVDPALDVGGNRLPNYFIDRGGNTAEELAGIKALAADLTPRDGVLIYPEGTRYSEAKRARISGKFTARDDRVSRLARSFRSVLPPRPAGTLALLEVTDADIVFLAHRGLEGFATVADIWSGGLVGSNVALTFWRVPRSRVPVGDGERSAWLFEMWAEVDAWVTADSSPI